MQSLLNYDSNPLSFQVNMLPPPSTGFPAWSRLINAHESSSVASAKPSLDFYNATNLAPLHMLPSSVNSAPSMPRPVVEAQSNSNLLTSLLLKLLQSKIATANVSSTSMMPPPSLVVPSYCPSNSFSAESSPQEISPPGTPESDASGEMESSTSVPPSNIVALYPRKKRGLESPSQDAVILDKKALSALYHLPLKEAAKALGICPTAIKTACRKLGLPKWPYRSIRKQCRRSMLAARARGASVGLAEVMPEGRTM
eukprot:2404702-Rhodomonas_salina.3